MNNCEPKGKTENKNYFKRLHTNFDEAILYFTLLFPTEPLRLEERMQEIFLLRYSISADC
jgi:hypothetical protein